MVRPLSDDLYGIIFITKCVYYFRFPVILDGQLSSVITTIETKTMRTLGLGVETRNTHETKIGKSQG
jgi:hypothetical protein